MTAKLIKDKTGRNGQQVTAARNQLMAAGWIRKVTTGLDGLLEDLFEE